MIHSTAHPLGGPLLGMTLERFNPDQGPTGAWTPFGRADTMRDIELRTGKSTDGIWRVITICLRVELIGKSSTA